MPFAIVPFGVHSKPPAARFTLAYCAAIAGVLTFIAFVAHAFFGTREFWRFKPSAEVPDSLQSWVQAVAGWQFASLDLLATSIVLFLVAFTDVIAQHSIVLTILGIYYFIVGTCWLLVVACIGTEVKGRWLKLGQWIFCYLVAVLSLVGAIL